MNIGDNTKMAHRRDRLRKTSSANKSAIKAATICLP